jgi:hypothetical protein
MNVKKSKVGWIFWLQWVLATSVGWFFGVFLGFFSGSFIWEEVIGISALGGIFAYFMFGAALGSVVSLMQWLVLRRRVSGAGWWILASTAGFAVVGASGYGAAVVTFGFSEGLDELGSFAALLGWSVVVAFGGAVTGILQRIILRTQVPRSGWWVLASTVGWGLSVTVGGAGIVVEAIEFLKLLSLVGGGVVLGAVTGGALVWLLRKPVPEI